MTIYTYIRYIKYEHFNDGDLKSFAPLYYQNKNLFILPIEINLNRGVMHTISVIFTFVIFMALIAIGQ